jgi:S1-C subfamily serine protease
MPGVLLADVVPGGPAAKAGLRKGDRITKVGATDVRNVQDLMVVLGNATPGQTVMIELLRDGKPTTATAVFGPPRLRRCPTAPSRVT